MYVRQYVCAVRITSESDHLSEGLFSLWRLEGSTEQDLNYFGSNTDPRIFMFLFGFSEQV